MYSRRFASVAPVASPCPADNPLDAREYVYGHSLSRSQSITVASISRRDARSYPSAEFSCRNSSTSVLGRSHPPEFSLTQRRRRADISRREVQSEERHPSDQTRRRGTPEEEARAWKRARDSVNHALGTMCIRGREIVPEVLRLGTDMLECVPIPGLAQAARLLSSIWNAMQQVESNQMRCLRLTERCAAILILVKQEVDMAGTAVVMDLERPIERLTNAFEAVHDLLEKQIHMSRIRRYLRRYEIWDEIEYCEAELNDAQNTFGVSVEIRILNATHSNEALRQADMRQLHNILASLASSPSSERHSQIQSQTSSSSDSLASGIIATPVSSPTSAPPSIAGASIPLQTSQLAASSASSFPGGIDGNELRRLLEELGRHIDQQGNPLDGNQSRSTTTGRGAPPDCLSTVVDLLRRALNVQGEWPQTRQSPTCTRRSITEASPSQAAYTRSMQDLFQALQTLSPNTAAEDLSDERLYRTILRHDFDASLKLPLWNPGPVLLGAVGYLDKSSGSFVTLFNALDPGRSFDGRLDHMASIHGFGRVGIQRVHARRRKRSLLRRYCDKFMSGLRTRKDSTGASSLATRKQTRRLQANHPAAYMFTEQPVYQCFEDLSASRKWFVANVDEITGVYGADDGIRKEELFLIIGTLEAPMYSLFVSRQHSDARVHFNLSSSTQIGRPSGWFSFDDTVIPMASAGPYYHERVPGGPRYNTKVSNVKPSGEQNDAVLLARLHFEPDAAEPTTL